MALKLKSPVTIALAVVAVGLIVLVAIIGPKKWHERQRSQLYRMAHVAMAKHDYQAAETHFKALLKYLPDSAAVMLYLSQVTAEQHEFDEALDWADKAADVEPGKPQPMGQKAAVLRHKAQHLLETEDAKPKVLDQVVSLCDQAKQLIDQAGKLTGADPSLQAEVGQLYVVRAREAQARARRLQEASEQARQAGQPDQAAKLQAQADPWRIKEHEWLNKAVEELSTAAKLAPAQMGITESLVRVCVQAGRYTEAVVAFRTATTAGKPTPRTAILAARAHLRSVATSRTTSRDRALRLAGEMLQQGIEAHPYNLDLKLELAEVELELGRVENAVEVLEASSMIDESAPKLRRLRARLLLIQGKPDEARRLLEELYAEHAENVELLLDLSEAVGICGQPERSLDLVEEAVQADAYHMQARLELARAFFRRGRWADAHDVLAAGLRLEPTNVELLAAATSAILRYDQDEKRLLEMLDRARKLGKVQPGFTGDLVLLAVRLDKPGWAERVLTEDKKLNPKMPIGAVVLAGVALNKGESRKALEGLQPLAARVEQFPHVQLLMGRARAGLGQLHQADVELEKALLASDNDYLTALQGIEVYLEAGMLAEAQRRSRRLLEDDPEAPASIHQAIRIDLMAGDAAKATRRAARLQALGATTQRPLDAAALSLLRGQAEKALSQAEKLAGPVASVIRADALWAAGKDDQALAELEKAVRAHPGVVSLAVRLADHAARSGRASEGVARLRKLGAKSPAGTALGLGYLHSLMNADQQALAVYRDAIARKPDKYHEGVLRLAMADCYKNLGQTEDQFKTYQEMRQDSAIGVKGLEAAVQMATRIGQAKQVTALLDNLGKPVGGQELSPDLLARLASAYSNADQPIKAVSVYDRIAKQIPDAVWVWREKVSTYLRAGQRGHAMRTLKKALGLWPGNRSLRLDLADLHLGEHAFADARRILTDLAAADTSQLARRDRGLMLESLGLFGAAETDLAASAAVKDTADFPAVAALARCLEGGGQAKKAIGLLERIPPTAGDYATSRARLARIHVELGQRDAATKVLQEAARRGRTELPEWSLFGECLRQGHLDDARKLAVRRAASAAMPDRLRWALAAGVIPEAKTVFDRQPGNVGLAVRLAGWYLAGGNAKGAREVLAGTSASGTTRPAETPGPMVQILNAVVEAKAGNASQARSRLEPLSEVEALPDGLRVAAVLARLTVDPKTSADAIRKKLGSCDELDLVLAVAERATSSEGRDVAAALAVSFLAERLRIPLMSHRLAANAIRADSDHPAAHAMRLRTLRAVGAEKSDLYQRLADEFLKRFGKTPLGPHVAVLRAIGANQIDQAAKLLGAWKNPTADALVAMAEGVSDAGKRSDALPWFERALKRDPERVSALCGVARLLIELRGDQAAALDRALKLAEQAMSLSNGSPQAAAALGSVLIRRGKVDQALPLLQRAIQEMPTDVALHYYLGRAHLASKDVAMARLHLRHVIETAKDKALLEAARQVLGDQPEPPATQKAA